MAGKGPKRLAHRKQAQIIQRKLRAKIADLQTEIRRLKGLLSAAGIRVSKPKRGRAVA